MATERIPLADRFWAKVLKTDTCWLWMAGKNNHGYGRFQYFNRHQRPGLGRDLYAHRVAWLLTNGEIPDGLNLLHRCDTPACVNPSHLFLGTQKDNMADAAAKGRTRTRPRWKLTLEDIRAIRADPRRHHIIAADYGVIRTTIWAVKARWRRYAHVD